MLQCKTKWKKKKLENLSDMQKGKLTEQGLFCQEDWIKLLNTETLFSNIETYASTRNAVIATEKDVLILCDGERSGLVAKGQNGVVGSTFAKLTVDNSEIDSNYLYHYLNDKFVWIQNRRTGTGVPHIPKDLSHILEINYPADKNVQQKIADILSTCDEVIEKTEETIEKYKQIKAGMMQDLFTRGLDANGKLRPTYYQAPDLYKYSEELDRYIPKEWDIKPMELVVKRIGDIDHYMPKSVEDGIPYIMTGDFIGNNDLDFKNAKKISMEDYETLSKKIKPEFNDIIIARYATVGTIRIVKTNKPFLVSYSCAIIKTDKKLLNPDYLAYYIKSDFCQNLIDLEINASTQKNIGIDTLKTISVFVPKYSKEQDNIVKTLNAIETKIEIEEQYLNKYKQIKQGLMKRLLTPPADAEIVEE